MIPRIAGDDEDVIASTPNFSGRGKRVLGNPSWVRSMNFTAIVQAGSFPIQGFLRKREKESSPRLSSRGMTDLPVASIANSETVEGFHWKLHLAISRANSQDS
jgi:hypothetical protein